MDTKFCDSARKLLGPILTFLRTSSPIVSIFSQPYMSCQPLTISEPSSGSLFIELWKVQSTGTDRFKWKVWNQGQLYVHKSSCAQYYNLRIGFLKNALNWRYAGNYYVVLVCKSFDCYIFDALTCSFFKRNTLKVTFKW